MARLEDREQRQPVKSGAVTVSHPDLEWHEMVQGASRATASSASPPTRVPPRGPRLPGAAAGRRGAARPARPIKRVKRVLIGRPIATADEPHERVNVFTGLAVFASDNISSSAYATEEIMRVLVLAGAGALALTLPITHRDRRGAGDRRASATSRRSAPTRAAAARTSSPATTSGTLAGLIAAGALLTDYVLTVAVSIAAGVAALTSIFPGLFDYRVAIGVGFVVLLALGNLRGIRESGTIFTAPTYVYLRGDLRPARLRPLPLRDGHAARRTQPPPEWLQAEHGDRGARPAADPARVRLGLGRADRHRGGLQRRAGLQAAGVAQRAASS